MKRTNNFKSNLLTATLIGTVLSFALPAHSTNHGPLIIKNMGAISTSEIMGENEISALAKAIEIQIMDKALRTKLENKVSESAIDAARIAYAQSVFKPLWTREAADTLHDMPKVLASHGLASDFNKEALDILITNRFESRNPNTQATAELKLTALWLRLASLASGGLTDQGEAVKSNFNAPVRSELTQSIKRAARGKPIAELEDFTPNAPQYLNLRRALEKYKKEASFRGWKAIPKGKGLIELSDEDERVPAIRQRLIDEGFLEPLISEPLKYVSLDASTDFKTPNKYDEVLEAAVKSFQKKHGMEIDGVIGKATLRAMNESPQSKIKSIEAALDYWRNLDAYNQQSGDRYIWVNVPSFRVEGWNNGKLEIAMDTIVGKKRTPTPSFSDEVEYIVANPKWFLPIGLFKRQKLRKLRKDPGYAARHHYKIYDRSTREELDPYSVDWAEKGISRKIQMVQQPGAHNALGELKIIFPNRHTVYLHSTPAKNLFERDIRAFSSGCIRLDDPVAMANWITDHDEAIETEDFNRTLNAEERDTFNLKQHLPVHITYIGVTADEKGNPTFHRDIYDQLEKPSFVTEVYDFTAESAQVSLKQKIKSVDTAQKPTNAIERMP